MKIALIHFNLTTESGDTKIILSVANELKKMGHAIVVYCAEFDSQACFPRLNKGLDIRVVPPEIALASTRGAAGTIAKIMERVSRTRIYNDLIRKMSAVIEKDFDYIVCENDYSYKIGLFYKKIRPGTKIIWVMHNPPFFHSAKKNILADLLSRCVAWYEKRLARKYGRGVDWIVAYDAPTERYAAEVGRPTKILRLPTDVAYFHVPVKTRTVSEKGVLLLGVGALNPHRRFEDIISAVGLLRERDWDARATIICKDFYGNKEYRSEFGAFLERSGVAEHIDARFAGASEEEYLTAMRLGDVFIFPTDVKIWAVGACEAASAGLPLIISKATAMAEVFHDGVDALFVDVLQPRQIADKVELLLRDREFAVRVALAGQKFVESEMSLDAYAREILKAPIHS